MSYQLDIPSLKRLFGDNKDKDFTAAQIKARLARWSKNDHQTVPQVRRAVRKLVDQGWPIVSTKKGFRYTTDAGEIQDAADRLIRRATSIFNRAVSLMDTAVVHARAAV